MDKEEDEFSSIVVSMAYLSHDVWNPEEGHSLPLG